MWDFLLLNNSHQKYFYRKTFLVGVSYGKHICTYEFGKCSDSITSQSAILWYLNKSEIQSNEPDKCLVCTEINMSV